MKVLVVEDEFTVRAFVTEELRFQGHEVTSCPNAENALEAYQQTFYPLILLDLGLPGMDGLELCRHIRALPQGELSLILISTGRDEPEVLQAALNAGADDYLLKPFNKERLHVRFTLLEKQYWNDSERKRVEVELSKYRKHLEELVAKRTAELEETNAQLQREIADRRQAEETLVREHNLLRTLIDNLPDFIYVKDLKSRFLLVNKAIARLIGAESPDELIGKTDFDFHPPELAGQYYADEQALLKSGQALINREEPVRDQQSGAMRELLTTKIPFRDSQGNIAGLVGLNRDITERKTTEKGLRQLRKAVETMQLGVTITDPNGKIIYANPTEAKLHGYQVEELIGKDLGIFAPPELRKPITLDQIKKLKTRIRESVNTRKDGGTFPVRLISDVVEDAKGVPIATVTICEDISERKRAEQALRAREQQYRLLAEHVADGIGIIQEKKLVFVNEALASILGFPAAQLVGMAPVDLFHEDYKGKFREMFENIERGIFHEYLQAVCITAAGQEVWIEERHSVIDWEGMPAIVFTMRDITKHKLQELAIEQEKNRLKKVNLAFRSALKDRYRLGDIIGKSPAMQEVYELILKASTSDANVVIYGESGTGKELIARTIHQLGDRHESPIVPVNCGAIPETLFESEFFGHRKGAFTGADRDKPGFFDAAHRGSLFLDEIGELPPAMQVKLLRALEDGGYTPLGENKPKQVDVRIIAATNRNLNEQIRKNAMREDFFYRIHVVSITVPPLRSRKEDIPLLVEHFLKHYGQGKKLSTLPGKILTALHSYDWPGNIRELQNALHRYLTVNRLDFIGARQPEAIEMDELVDAEFEQKDRTLREAVEQFEKQFLAKMLERHRWHREKTAVTLDIEPRTLRRKIKKYGLS